jgi:hypothetical protein
MCNRCSEAKHQQTALTLEQAWRNAPVAVEELFNFTASFYDETCVAFAYASVGELVTAIMTNRAQFQSFAAGALRFTTDIGYTGVWNGKEKLWEWTYD